MTVTFINHFATRQLTLKRKGFKMLEIFLLALVVMFSVPIVFNCFCSIYLLFCFFGISFFKISWAYSFDLIFDSLLRNFQMIVFLCR